MPIERWTDAGLDRLQGEVDATRHLTVDVAVMKAEMTTLSRELKRNTDATEHVAEQFEKAQLEPLRRGRNFREQVILVLIGAVAGGVFILAGTLLTHV